MENAEKYLKTEFKSVGRKSGGGKFCDINNLLPVTEIYAYLFESMNMGEDKVKVSELCMVSINCAHHRGIFGRQHVQNKREGSLH